MQQADASHIIRAVRQILDRKEFLFWKKFERAFPKGEVYLVGGAVRDMALGRETKDYDFVVRNVPVARLTAFLKKNGRVDLVGRQFGVLKFLPRGYEGEPIDIALPRTEHTIDGTGGYKDFHIQSDASLSIEEDLARRDFTINAIAVTLKSKILNSKSKTNSKFKIQNSKFVIIDPYGGLQDLRRSLIRTVGKPKHRFAEDYSRMLRGLRFACQLGFAIEQKTWGAIKNEMACINKKQPIRSSLRGAPPWRGDVAIPKRLLRDARNDEDAYVVPRETVGRELVKAFVADPVKATDLWDKSGAFEQLMPELLKMKKCPQPKEFHTEGDVWKHTRLALKEIDTPAFRRRFPDLKHCATLVLGVLLHDIGKPVTLQTPKQHGTDRIRFTEHDTKGASLTRAICERLRLSQFSIEDVRHHIDTKTLWWLVRNHLLLNVERAQIMRATTIEKYFMRDPVRGDLLKALIWADTRATLPPGKQPSLRHLQILEERIREISKRLRRTHTKPLLNGDEIMKVLHLKPGKYIGALLNALREEQLSGRIIKKIQAIDFLRTRRIL